VVYRHDFDHFARRVIKFVTGCKACSLMMRRLRSTS